MADTAVAEAQQEEVEFVYPITVESAGPATKKVTIEIPESRIRETLDRQFKELRTQAALPGFRPGKVPQKLLEKRFNKAVREDVTRTLLQESYQQAVEKHNLKVVGEPSFDEQTQIELPETGSLTYSFSIEVQPEFSLPDLSSITVKKPKIEIKDEHIEQARQNLREQQGTLLPVEGRGIQEGDIVSADVHVKLDGEDVLHQHDLQFKVKPGTILAIQIDDLPAQLSGAQVGETRTLTVKVNPKHPTEKIRDKDVQIEFKIKDIRQLELAEIDSDFLQQLGFENEQQLNDALREEMEARVKNDLQNHLRDQVAQALLDGVQMELPEKLSKQQEGRVVQRRAVDLLRRGVPEGEIIANIENLKGGAKDEAVRELKLFFILSKIAEEYDVDVTEGELNANIAAMAAQQGTRPEKLKQQMAKEGSLQTLYIRLRELKAIDKILEKVKVEEVEPEKKDA
ncbi:MAG: trigger factor [Phycisphaerae bacterium]|nr:MAG: trigger factor [Phycisphaerae bacterium]